jgi:hypothetical protein
MGKRFMSNKTPVRHWKLLACLLLMLLFATLVGCNINGSSIARATIQTFNSDGKMVSFYIEVVPEQSKIVLGDGYSVVLMSRDGYIFDHKEVQWLSSEFRLSSSSNDRDISGQIDATRVKGLRALVLTASQTDKDIYPMLVELGELETKMENQMQQAQIDAWEAWIQKGSLVNVDPNKYNITESNYQRIANKYVKIVVMSYDEFLEMSQEQ